MALDYNQFLILKKKNSLLKNITLLGIKGKEVVYYDCLDDKQKIAFKISKNSDKIYGINTELIETIDNMNVERYLESCDIMEDNTDLNAIIQEETDVVNELEGTNLTEYHGIKLIENMFITFKNDKSKDYNFKRYSVSGVGENIKLMRNRGRPKKIKVA